MTKNTAPLGAYSCDAGTPAPSNVVTESACTDANEGSLAIVELGGAYACDNSTNGTIPTPSSNATHTPLLLATCNTSSGVIVSFGALRLAARRAAAKVD